MLAIDLEDTTRDEVAGACHSCWPRAEIVSITGAEIFSGVLKTLNPNIIILDVDASLIGTSSTVQEIRGFSSSPIIALSYASDVGKTVRILQEGADCFMLKPVHQRELVAHIDSLLKNEDARLKEYKKETMPKAKPGETSCGY